MKLINVVCLSMSEMKTKTLIRITKLINNCAAGGRTCHGCYVDHFSKLQNCTGQTDGNVQRPRM